MLAGLRSAARRLAPGVRQLSSKPKTAPHPFDSFLSGNSSAYVEDMYHAWKQVRASQLSLALVRWEGLARGGAGWLGPGAIV
jgi:hypothetical protein